MASIETRIKKNGSKSYRTVVYLPNGKRVNKTFSRKEDAKRYAIKFQSEIQQRRFSLMLESEKHTTNDMINYYRASVLPHLKDSQHREFHLKQLEEHCGTCKLSEISPAVIASLRDKLLQTPATEGRHKGNPRSQVTVNRYLATYRAMFNICVNELGWMTENPVKKVKFFKEPPGRTRFLEGDQIQRVLQAAKELGPKTHLLYVLALVTGARRSELRYLKWENVRLDQGLIILNDTKNGETRSLMITETITAELKRQSAVANSAYIFSRDDDPDRVIPIDDIWKKIRKVAELEGFRFHDLRHTAASNMAMSGAGIREIGDLLGDKTLAMVKRYSHLCNDHRRIVVERMVSNKLQPYM
jgi:integrase